MIDFRYHLVSLISVFLALAVGIVLGAGPLQADIGSQLNDQVASLRTEKQELHDRLDANEKLVVAANELGEAVVGRVVSDRLRGHRVVVVALPSADGTLVSNLEGALAASGADRTATVEVTPDWFDPSQSADRLDASRAAGLALGLDPAGGADDSRLAEILARILVTSDESSAPTITPASGAADALDALSGAGLVNSSADTPSPADLVVVVSGEFAGTEAEVTQRAIATRVLVHALVERSRAAVVAGPEPVVAAGQPVTSDAVAAVREDDTSASEVSTVDHARDGSGPALVVLALESELDEHIGHYGTAKGATAAVPRVLP